MMRTRLLLSMALSGICLSTYALSPPETEKPVAEEAASAVALPSEAQDSDTAVEVRNNTTAAIFVVQKGIKTEVASKETHIVKDTTAFPVSITPTNGTPSIKYVTLTRKGGACKLASCLIVQ